jgi:isopenicillin-N N-acyltransferase-like protein
MNAYWFFVSILFVAQTGFAHNGGPFKNLGNFCKDDIPQGTPNTLPIEVGPPRLIRTVENGSLYQVGAGDDQSWLVHVWGMNGYDYGFAYGTLLSEQINQLMPNAYVYFEKEILEKMDKLKLPDWFKELIADKGLGLALDTQNAMVEPYMDQEIYREIRGIADAAKIDYKLLVRLHMFGELTKGNIRDKTFASN